MNLESLGPIDCTAYGTQTRGEGLTRESTKYWVFDRREIERALGATLDDVTAEASWGFVLNALFEDPRFCESSVPRAGQWFWSSPGVRFSRTKLLVTVRGYYDV